MSAKPNKERCIRCGTVLIDGSTEGLCAGCLLEAGLAFEAPADQAHGGLPLARFGDYDLLEEIARGGMGAVFKARQRSLGRIVAVKTILAGRLAGADEVARFKREAEAAARLKHPNIVGIHEVGECDGQHFFSMDYVEGRSLAALIRDSLPAAPQSARYVEKIARAVHYAHEHDVLHRDLKPSNVLLDARDEPHITDFGLARQLEPEREAGESELTLSGQVLGTPSFMPPEQAGGRRDQVGPRSDVYSLGAILYHLLTGRPPFVGADAHSILAQVLGTEVITSRLLNPFVPRDLETIALKCLEKDPARRYASALALAEDLARHLNHQPIHAVPPSAIYRARKFVRRHRTAVVVAACFALVLTGATLVSAIFGLRANRERRAALMAKAETEKARNLALENAQAARESDTNAQKVLKFFSQKILAATRPVESGGLGRTASVREAVVAAERDITEALGDYSLAEAAVRGTLGLAHIYLGEPSNAVVLLERAAELFRQIGGPHHEQTLATMDLLGLAYSDLGRFDQAAGVHRHTLAELIAVHGWGHSNTMMAAHNLAETYQYLGRNREAVELFERVVAWRSQHLGRENPSTVDSLRALGSAYRQARQLSNAVAILEQCFEIEQRTTSTNDLGGLATMGALANAYQDSGRLANILPLRLENVARRERVQGPDHVDTLSAKQNLASTYKSLGRLGEAIALHSAVLARRQDKLGPAHPHTLMSMESLASACSATNRQREAISLLTRAASLAEAALGSHHHRNLSIMDNLAMTLRDAGQMQEAVIWSERVAARARSSPGTNDLAAINYLHNLARNYKAAGRLDDAIPLFDEVLGLFRVVAGPAHRDTLACLHNLAGTYVMTNRLPEAINLFTQTVQIKRAHLGERHKDTLLSVDALADACFRGGEFKRAEAALGELLAVQRTQYPRSSGVLADLLTRLGEARLQQGDFAAAEEPLREALSIHGERQPGLSPSLGVQALLGWSLLGQRKHPAAERMLLQSHEGLSKRQAERPSTSRALLLRSTAERLAQLYEDWGKPVEAGKWRRKTQ